MRRRDFINLTALGVSGLAIGSANANHKQTQVVSSGNEEVLDGENQWIVYNDGTFDLITEEIKILSIRPSFDDQSVLSKKVEVVHNGTEKEITYFLQTGEISITLGIQDSYLSLRAKMKNIEKAPHWFYPISSGKVFQVNRFFKQGLGFGGPSATVLLPIAGERNWNIEVQEMTWSYDSYLASALISPNNKSVAIGSMEHHNFLQRSSIYNRNHRYGLVDRFTDVDYQFFEAGFSMECIEIQGEVVLPEIRIYQGNDAFNTLRNLAQAIALHHQVILSKPPAYHYCSWYEFGSSFDENRLDEVLQGLKNIKPSIPLQSVQIDDGYCIHGDWLECNDLWKSGLQKSFEKIRKDGYRAGIWIAPFMVNNTSNLYKKHPDWVVCDFDGKPIIEWNKDGQEWYYLDTSHPDAFEYIRTVFKTMKSWGANYYKTDFLDWGLKDSIKVARYKPGKTSVQYFTDVMKMIRKEIGEESYWLACISPFSPQIGLVDAIRVSNDVGHVWSNGSAGNMLRETFACQYFNNVLYQVDPDVLYLRHFNTELSENQILAVAYWNGILGGIVNTSDRFHLLAPDRLRLWRFLQPTLQKEIANLPFFAEQKQIFVAARYYKEQDAWGVLFLNPTQTKASDTFTMQSLIGSAKTTVFEWSFEKSELKGDMNEISIQLDPTQAKLFYFSANGKAPNKQLCISGLINKDL